MEIALLVGVLFLGTAGMLPVLHWLGYRVNVSFAIYRIDIDDGDDDDDSDSPAPRRPFAESLN